MDKISEHKTEAINNLIASEGWQIINEFIDKRIAGCRARAAEYDVSDVEIKEYNGKPKVKIVIINKDIHRQELRIWQMFRDQVNKMKGGDF